MDRRSGEMVLVNNKIILVGKLLLWGVSLHSIIACFTTPTCPQVFYLLLMMQGWQGLIPACWKDWWSHAEKVHQSPRKAEGTPLAVQRLSAGEVGSRFAIDSDGRRHSWESIPVRKHSVFSVLASHRHFFFPPSFFIIRDLLFATVFCFFFPR